MCGIVGTVGKADATPILLEGLSRLEYRGYDSAGVAVVQDGKLCVEKAKGRLDNLRGRLKERPLGGTLGIGHTRWATHGEPSDVNSHPHTDVKGEIAVLKAEGVAVYDAYGRRRTDLQPFHVDWDVASAEKSGYPHFMLKEIMEEPRALSETLRSHVDLTSLTIQQEGMPDAEEARALKRVFIVACGTAYHAGVVGKYALEQLTGLSVTVDIASEYRYRPQKLGKGDLFLVISQSGETADTLAALREAKRQGAKVAAITNVVGSSVAREADRVLYTWAGPEIAVASTKAYITQLLLLTLLGVDLALKRGEMDEKAARELLREMQALPEKAQKTVETHERMQRFAARHFDLRHVFYIGRGMDWALAMEASLKLKEISYIFSEAYAAGELKHGTIALIEPGTLVVALCTQSALLEKCAPISRRCARAGRACCAYSAKATARRRRTSPTRPGSSRTRRTC